MENNLKKLIIKAKEHDGRLLIRFDMRQDDDEVWGVKLYPNYSNNEHYYAYHSDLDAACREILDEMSGFSAWD